MSSAALLQDDHHTWARDISAAIARKCQNRGTVFPHEPSNQLLQNALSQNRPDQLQGMSPSYAPKHGEEGGDMQSPASGRNVLGLCKNEVRDRIATALRAVPSAKHIARDTADAGHPLSTDSAENLRSGINIPNGFNLILLARIYPELRAVVRQLIDSDFDQDPKAYALFISAMQYAQGRVK